MDCIAVTSTVDCYGVGVYGLCFCLCLSNCVPKVIDGCDGARSCMAHVARADADVEDMVSNATELHGWQEMGGAV